jgi:magnesium transporter
MLYLSQILGKPVRDRHDEPIGKLADLIVAIGGRYPPITGLVVQTDGRRRIFLPWSDVAHFGPDGAQLATTRIDIDRFKQRPNELLLHADLQDKQIVDIDGRKVVRVNDLRLEEIEGRYRLVSVDVGAAGLLRRLGLEGPFRTIARNMNVALPERYIDWEDVDPVESTISSIRLRVPHRGLRELHPADLASIIEDLAPRDRLGVMESLDDERAADALEEMEPETQVEVLEDLSPERAADILEEMAPDDRADLIADLSESARNEILQLMEHDEAEEARELLGYPEDSAGGIMTPDFVALPSHVTAAQAIERIRELEPDAETIYYLYVTDDEGKLAGVLSLRDLIVAKPETRISDFMHTELVAVNALAHEDEVAQAVAHYNLLAVPVVDEDGHLLGIVTVDDALDTVLPSAWKRRLPRLFSRSGS